MDPMPNPLAGLPWLEAAVGWLITAGLRIVLIVALAALVYRIARQTVPPLLRLGLVKPVPGADEAEQRRRCETLTSVFLRTVQVALIVIGGFMVLSVLEVNIAPALAGLSVAGIAVGLGAQSLVRDALAGLFILIENQFAKGDTIRIGSVTGLVEDVNLRRTVLRDLDGAVHFIPNGEIKMVTNLTRDWSRVHLDLRLDFETDLDRAIAVIDQIGQELAADRTWGPQIIAPPQFVRVDRYEDGRLILKVLGETRPGKQWDLTGELLRRLRTGFAAEGLPLPGARPVIANSAPSPAPAGPAPPPPAPPPPGVSTGLPPR